MLSQNTFDGIVGFKRNSLLVNFSVSSFQDKSSNSLSGGISVCDVWFNSSEHIDGSFVDSDEDSVVKLS